MVIDFIFKLCKKHHSNVALRQNELSALIDKWEYCSYRDAHNLTKSAVTESMATFEWDKPGSIKPPLEAKHFAAAIDAWVSTDQSSWTSFTGSSSSLDLHSRLRTFSYKDDQAASTNDNRDMKGLPEKEEEDGTAVSAT
jgi:hypothetical protein